MSKKLAVLAVLLLLALIGPLVAKADEIILLGNDTSAPASMYSLNGTFLESFGPSGATGTAFDGAGHAFVMYPFESIIREFDSLANVVGTIPNNFGFGEDMAFGGNGTL